MTSARRPGNRSRPPGVYTIEREMVIGMTGILPPAEPTAEEVYEATLDGLYNGEESGSVEAPTGWFALVQWPENELWYIVGEDNYGFKTLSGYGKDEAMARAAYAALDQEYGDWFGDNYDDAEHEVSSGE